LDNYFSWKIWFFLWDHAEKVLNKYYFLDMCHYVLLYKFLCGNVLLIEKSPMKTISL
jgi:hypothetical protein